MRNVWRGTGGPLAVSHLVQDSNFQIDYRFAVADECRHFASLVGFRIRMGILQREFVVAKPGELDTLSLRRWYQYPGSLLGSRAAVFIRG